MNQTSSGYLVTEYVEQVREQAAITCAQLDCVSQAIKNRVDTGILPDLQRTLDVIGRMHYIAESGRMTLEIHPENLKEANTLRANLDQFSTASNYLSQVTIQSLEEQMTEQTYFRFMSVEEHEYRKPLISLQQLAKFLFERYYPEPYSKEIAVIPLFDDVMGYNVHFLEVISPRVAFVIVPRVDSCRCRFWTWLGHEVFHGRFRSRLDDEWEAKKSQAIGDIRNLAMRRFGMTPGTTAARHLEELTCDTAAARIFGLAYLFTLSSTYMNPRSEASAFDEHPPMTSRVRYLSRLLQRTGSGSSMADLAEKLGVSWDEQLYSGGFSYREATYIEEYDDLLDLYEDVLLDLSSQYAPALDSCTFDAKCWSGMEGTFKVLENGKDLLEIEIDFPELLNLVWLKRVNCFDSIPAGTKQKSEFIISRKFDEKMTSKVIKYIFDKKRL